MGEEADVIAAIAASFGDFQNQTANPGDGEEAA
jgi:hypothetical protein